MKIAFVLDEIVSGQVPLGVGFIGAMLKKHGHEVGYFCLDPEGAYLKQVKDFGPRIAAYSASTGLHKLYLESNLKLKKLHPVFAVFGGPHPTYFPEIIEEDGVDAICVGEGEYPMLELVTALEKGEEPTTIKNIHYKGSQGKIHHNPTRPYHQNLDELPFPDIDIVDWIPRYKEIGIAYVIAGRGCPYRCNFCFNHVAMKTQSGKFVRMRGIDNVLEEIKVIRERYPLNMVAFQDDTFTLHKDWLLEFAPRYKEEIGLPYLVHTRADIFDEDMARALGETGCLRVVVGLESGSDHIRNIILHKNVTTENILNTARLIKENGMEVVTQNLFGVPEDTVATVMSTIELNVKCRSDIMVLHFFQPYPRTKLAEMTEELGLYSGTLDDIPYSNHWRIVLDLKNKEVMEGLAKLSWFFVDYPQYFSLVKTLLPLVPFQAGRMLLIKYLNRRDQKLLQSPQRGAGSRYHPPAKLQHTSVSLQAAPGC